MDHEVVFTQSPICHVSGHARVFPGDLQFTIWRAAVVRSVFGSFPPLWGAVRIGDIALERRKLPASISLSELHALGARIFQSSITRISCVLSVLTSGLLVLIKKFPRNQRTLNLADRLRLILSF